jgi:hypothetical protein
VRTGVTTARSFRRSDPRGRRPVSIRPTASVRFRTMGQFFYRVEHGDAKLLGRCRGNAFDAAIVQARYIAPDPDGKLKEPDELRNALRACGAPWLIDLGTPQLCDGNILLVEGMARLRASSVGRSSPLPLDPAKLENADARDSFVDACAAFQVGAPILAAPYLEFTGADDPRLETNLAMLRRIVGAAGDRPSVGFVQVTLEGLNHGLPARIAHYYAATGVRTIFLRVRNFRAESATVKQARAYESTLDAYASQGIGIVADQVGRFGGFAVGCGAVGFSGGAQHFRSVPRRAVSPRGGGGGPKLPVEIPHRWLAVPRDLAPRSIDCPVAECAVAAGDRSLDAFREHDLHFQRFLAAQLGPDVLKLAEDLRQSGQPHVRAWADLLERRQRRSA